LLAFINDNNKPVHQPQSLLLAQEWQSDEESHFLLANDGGGAF
jgi:hypothetical protein